MQVTAKTSVEDLIDMLDRKEAAEREKAAAGGNVIDVTPTAPRGHEVGQT